MEAATEQDFTIYAVEEACGKRHTLLQAPHALPGSLSSNETIQPHDVFNILMADVSGSMSSYWKEVVTGWQNHIKDKLTGKFLRFFCLILPIVVLCNRIMLG